MRDDLRDAIHNDAQMHIIHIQTTFVPLHAMMVKVVRDVLLSINHYQKITFHTFKSFSPNSLPGWVGRWNNTATQSSCAFASSVWGLGFLGTFFEAADETDSDSPECTSRKGNLRGPVAAWRTKTLVEVEVLRSFFCVLSGVPL